MDWRSRTGLTRRGTAYLALGTVLVLAAWRLSEPNLVWPGIFLALLPLGSLLLVVAQPPLRVTRTVTPGELPVGATLRVTLSITADRASIPGELRFEDRLPTSLGVAHTFVLPLQQRDQRTTERYERRPRRRGHVTLDDLWVRAEDPLGLAGRSARHAAPAAVTVTPLVIPLSPTGQWAFGRQGETPIPQTALAGPDDALVREYHANDDVRRVHWPSTARAGELMVRREEQAWDPTAWVILDSRSVAHGGARDTSASFEWLVTLAASVGSQLLADGYDVSLADAGGDTYASRRRGNESPGRGWLEHLVDVSLTGERTLGPATRAVAPDTSGHMVVALLGALDADAAAHLVGTHDSSQQCRALVLASDGEGERLLVEHGWLVERTGVGSDVAAAWHRFGLRTGAPSR